MLNGRARFDRQVSPGATRRLVAASVLVVGAAVGAVHARALGMPVPQSATAGPYTEAQSQRGDAVSEKSCVSCHGPKLTGTDVGPTLQGEYFMMNWGGKPAAELFDRIHTTMPADAPGSLTPQQTVDVIAYVLKLNNFAPGAAELSTDTGALGTVKIAH